VARSLTSKLPSTIYFNIFQCYVPVFAQLKFQGHWVLASHPCPFQIHVLRHSSSIFLLRHGLCLRGRNGQGEWSVFRVKQSPTIILITMIIKTHGVSMSCQSNPCAGLCSAHLRMFF
jgi:hypothetical protein